MGALLIVLALIVAGLTTAVAALWQFRRESGGQVVWWGTRRGIGSLGLLAGGAALVLVCVRLLVNCLAEDTDALSSWSPRFAMLVAGTLVLQIVGLGLRAAGGGMARNSTAQGRAVVGASLLVAVLLTLVGLSAVPIFDQWIIREIPGIALPFTPAQPGQTFFGKKYEFTEDKDWFSSNRPLWETALARYRGKPNIRYLEVGLFEGRSALWMLENILTDPTAHLTGIDLFHDPYYLGGKRGRTYKDVFYSNLALSGSERKARIIEGFSQEELRKLPLASFDLIYIDGSHNSRDVLEDAVLSWRLLKDGGLMILDDYKPITSVKRAVDTFFAFFADDFQPIHIGAQVILQKRQRDRSRPGTW